MGEARLGLPGGAGSLPLRHPVTPTLNTLRKVRGRAVDADQRTDGSDQHSVGFGQKLRLSVRPFLWANDIGYADDAPYKVISLLPGLLGYRAYRSGAADSRVGLCNATFAAKSRIGVARNAR